MRCLDSITDSMDMNLGKLWVYSIVLGDSSISLTLVQASSTLSREGVR